MNLSRYNKFIVAVCGAVLGVLQTPDLAHNWRLAAAGFVTALLVFFAPNAVKQAASAPPAPPAPPVAEPAGPEPAKM